MAIPEVKIEVEDGALGVVPDSPAHVHVKLGPCPGGVANTLYSFATPSAARAALGQGPTVEAACASLDEAGGPVLVMPLPPSQQGTVSAVSQVGTGTGTIAPARAPAQLITVEVTTPGTQAGGTVRIRTKLGAGAFTVPYAIPTTGAILIPGTFTYLTLADGTGFDAGDIFTIATDGTITQTANPGPGTGNVTTQASSPLDAYSVIVTMVLGGALGTATFTYSLDGGQNTSEVNTVPGSGKFILPGTGIWLTFAGTFVAGDVYSFTSTTAGFTSGEVTTALQALRAAPDEWAFVHVVGTPATAAAAASLAAVVDAQMVAAEPEFRFVWGIVECPQTEGDTAIKAAFAAFSSLRVAIGVGDFAHVSTITGRTTRRNAAWQVANRTAKVAPGTSIAKVRDGALSQIGTIGGVSLFRDEAVTPGLHDARFCTLRTLRGKAGYFITMGNIMAPVGSDFSRIQNRRVMDEACRITRIAELAFLNEDVRVDAATGFIDERDAAAFEAIVNAQLTAAIVTPGDAVKSTVKVDRSVNLLSVSEQPVEVRIVPKAYLEAIKTKIGFTNPALQAAA
jgi:hypothetical protein